MTNKLLYKIIIFTNFNQNNNIIVFIVSETKD